MFVLTDEWKKAWPKALIGAMLISSVEPVSTKNLQTRTKDDMQVELRRRLSKLSKEELDALEPVNAYSHYYKRFSLPFDLRVCLEATLIGDKPRSTLHPVIEAVFQASINNLIPTTCHDRDMIHKPLLVQAAAPGQKLSLSAGKQREVLEGDMIVSDSRGLVASALYNSDHHTRMRSDTRRCLILAFAPPPMTATLLHQHLFSIHALIRRFSPQLEINFFQVMSASTR